MSAQNQPFRLQCSGNSIELAIASTLIANSNNPNQLQQLLEAFLRALKGRGVNIGDLCIVTRRGQREQLVARLTQLHGNRNADTALQSLLSELEESSVGRWDSVRKQCDTGSQAMRAYREYEFLAKTCYGGNRARNFVEMIGGIARNAFGGTGDCEKCRAALFLLAYYSAAVTSNQRTGCRLENTLWVGEILRMLAGSARSTVSLCPWEGDAAAALYATLAYCSNCLQSSSGINATIRVTVDGRNTLALRATLQ